MKIKRGVAGLFFGAFCVSACATMAVISVAQAYNTASEILTVPFVSARSPQTKDFHALTIHQGKRNPYFLRTNSSPSYKDSYCGVLLNRGNGIGGIENFHSLSFDYKGSVDSKAYLQYRLKDGPPMFRFLSVKEGKQSKTDKDGFRNITFGSEQFGLSPGTYIDQIALISPTNSGASSFVDNVQLNGNPIRKILAAQFYDLATSGAPVQNVSFAAAAPSSATQFTIYNNSSTKDTEAWVTVQSGSVGSAFQFSGPQSANAAWAGGGTGLSDHVKLPKKVSGAVQLFVYSTASTLNPSVSFGYTPSQAQKILEPILLPLYPASSWTITYPPTPINPTLATPCPVKQTFPGAQVSYKGGTSMPINVSCSALYSCGANVFEGAFNQGANSTESVDLSLENGMNSLMGVSLNGGPSWNSNSITVYGTSLVTPVSSNLGRYGVFQYNVPHCTSAVCNNTNLEYSYIYNWSQCSYVTGTAPNVPTNNCSIGNLPTQLASQPTCPLQRTGMGGSVTVYFTGYARDQNKSYCQ